MRIISPRVSKKNAEEIIYGRFNKLTFAFSPEKSWSWKIIIKNTVCDRFHLRTKVVKINNYFVTFKLRVNALLVAFSLHLSGSNPTFDFDTLPSNGFLKTLHMTSFSMTMQYSSIFRDLPQVSRVKTRPCRKYYRNKSNKNNVDKNRIITINLLQ